MNPVAAAAVHHGMTNNVRAAAVSLILGLLPAMALAAAPALPGQRDVHPAADRAPDHIETDAPVPGIPPAGQSPADRVAPAGAAAEDAGPVNSTPFSAAPTATISDGGRTGSINERVRQPTDTAIVPNLRK